MSSLQDARDALQRGDLEQVQVITADLLKSDPNSAEAWYILSQAVDGDRQQIFKQKALALDPEVEAQFEPESDVENLADELFDFSSPAFPDLMGPADDGEPDDFGEAGDALADDDFYVEVEAPAEEEVFEVSTPETEAPPAVDNAREAVTANGTSFDSSLIILAVLGLLILVVAYLFVRSLIG